MGKKNKKNARGPYEDTVEAQGTVRVKDWNHSRRGAGNKEGYSMVVLEGKKSRGSRRRCPNLLVCVGAYIKVQIG